MAHDSKKYTADDLTLAESAIERIRRNPARYLGARLPTAPFLASALVQDALICGIKDIRVQRHDDNWTSVSAREDWILPNIGIPSEQSPGYEHVFRTLVPFPQAGANSFRSEVLVAAFSSDVSVIQSGTVHICEGHSTPPESVIAAVRSMQFAVIFRL
jgi:hypothetical protein